MFAQSGCRCGVVESDVLWHFRDEIQAPIRRNTAHGVDLHRGFGLGCADATS